MNVAKFLSILLLISLYYSCSAHLSNTTRKSVGLRIGFVKSEKYIFDIDTISFKKELENLIQIPELNLDKIEIRKDTLNGNEHGEYYMLIAHDQSKHLKIARWLVRNNNELYYFKNHNGEETSNEIFYCTYYTCYGSSNNCFPRVFSIDNEFIWATSEKLICSPDDPCKSTSTYTPNE